MAMSNYARQKRWLDRLRAKAARADELETALKPFAHRADAFDAVDRTYSTEDWTPELLNDFRRARTALKGTK